jgi:hypothetical protein
MNDAEKVELAREIILHVALHWEDAPEAFVLRDGDEITFNFTLPTNNDISSISINPLNQVIQIITSFLSKYPNELSEPEIGSIRRSAITRLTMMLRLAPHFYTESFKYLSSLAEEMIVYDLCDHFGTLHAWNKRFKALKGMFEEWPESFIRPKAVRQQPSLIPVKIVGIVRKDFNENGKRPSRNRVARLLDVTPRALDKFAEVRGYQTFNKWLDVLFENDTFLRKER